MSPEHEEIVESNSDHEDETNEQIATPSTTATKSVTKRRTKTGCLTCRKRRIKCGEERPTCKNCIKSKRECAGYNPPQLFKHQTGDLSSASTFPSTQSINYIDNDSQYHETVGNHQYNVNQHGAVAGNDFSAVYTPFSANHESFPYDQDLNLNHFGTGPSSQFGNSNADFHQSQWPQTSLGNNFVPDRSRSITDSGLMSSRHPSLAFIDTTGNDQAPNHYSTPTSLYSMTNEPSLLSSTSTHPEISTNTLGSRYSISSSISGTPQNLHNNVPPPNSNDYNKASGFGIEIGGKYHLHDNKIAYQSENTATQHVKIPYTPMSDLESTLAISPDSPLLSDESLSIFQHFLDFTGPCMSIFDRLEDLGAYKLPKMAWTHSLPAMALKHEAFAHSILAVGALHLARLQQGSMETAIKHFSFAIGRVGKLLGSEDTRHHISTLATVLLLAYYEVMAGDHSRWSLHLSGAARLVMEHNYSGMTRSVRRLRTQAKAKINRLWIGQHTMSTTYIQQIAGIPEALLDDKEWEVDQELVSSLMGTEINYDSQMQANFNMQSDPPRLSDAEVEDLRTLKELYWFYCKQDIFQSMLSGDPLMLPYSRWKHCPPRGQIGNADRAHATADYLWLLMARLVTFGARDRIRKQKVVASQGGEWIPQPGFLPRPPTQSNDKGPPEMKQPNSKPQVPQNRDNASRHGLPPTANEGRARRKSPSTTTATPSGPPMMYGMIPLPAGPIQMSSSFEVMDAELQKDAKNSPESNTSSENLEFDLNTALEEHSSISKAFDRFMSCLGPDFEPLSPDQYLKTPFGPAVRFKSPTIAAMWAFYHVGRILLRRYHPHSPPAAMVSAGVNASVTHEHAQMIGRICAGLYVQYSYLTQAGYTDHIFTAAITETTFPLLFAGVQYSDPIQRCWTINKLKEISELGWASSVSIASACEAMWEKMGMAGKGPPYQRTIDSDDSDARFRGREGVGASNPADNHNNGSVKDMLKEHESRFVSHDRDLIVRHGSTRAYWALGLLSVEDDLERMNLTEHEEENKK